MTRVKRGSVIDLMREGNSLDSRDESVFFTWERWGTKSYIVGAWVICADTARTIWESL